jgi:hypothetical protein
MFMDNNECFRFGRKLSSQVIHSDAKKIASTLSTYRYIHNKNRQTIGMPISIEILAMIYRLNYIENYMC